MIKRRINNTDIVFLPETMQLFYKLHSCGGEDGSEIKLDDTCAKHDRKRNLLLRFLLTNNCNMRCSYCQMRKLFDGEIIYIKNQTVDELLQELQLESYEYITIHFSGGEPLLATALIEYICDKFTNIMPGRIRFAMSTNGTLLNRNNIELIKKYKIQTVVSVDGDESDNSSRNFVSGKKSFDVLIEKLDLLEKSNVPIGLSMVYTGQKANDIISFVKRININNRIQSLGFNYLHYPAFERTEESLQAYSEVLWSVYEFCRANNIFEEQSNRIIEPFVFSNPRLSHCSSTSSQITVGPDGVIAPCKTFLTGKLDSFGINEINKKRGVEILDKWRQNICTNINDCKMCDYRYLCGGGCRYEAYVDCGDINQKDERYCCVVKNIFEKLLMKLEAMGVFNEATLDFKLLTYEKKKWLLSSLNADKYGLTASIGHFLE